MYVCSLHLKSAEWPHFFSEDPKITTHLNFVQSRDGEINRWINLIEIEHKSTIDDINARNLK